MGVNPGSTVVYPFADKEQGGFDKVETDWAFVTPEAYFVYQAKKALQAQLEFADENGYTDVANYVALYEKQTPRLRSWRVLRMNCNRL